MWLAGGQRLLPLPRATRRPRPCPRPCARRFFGGFGFGGFGFGQEEEQTPKGNTVRVELEVTLKDLYLGNHLQVCGRAGCVCVCLFVGVYLGVCICKCVSVSVSRSF